MRKIILTLILTLLVNKAQGKHKKGIDVDFDEGEFLQFYLNGNTIDYPQVLIEITWRQ